MKHVPSLLLCGLLTGCGGGDDDDDDEGTVDPSASVTRPAAVDDAQVADDASAPGPDGIRDADDPLAGRWEGACAPVPGSGYVATSITFAGAASSTGSVAYVDPGCSSEALRFDLPAELITGERFVLEDGTEATELDIRYRGRALLSFRDAGFVRRANAERLCGRRDWVAGESVDVADCDVVAGFDVLLGETALQAVAIESGELYLGDAFSAPSGSPLFGRVARLDRNNPHSLASR